MAKKITLADIIKGREQEYNGYSPLPPPAPNNEPKKSIPTTNQPITDNRPITTSSSALPPTTTPANQFLLECLGVMSQIRSKRCRTPGDIHALRIQLPYELVNHGRPQGEQNTRFKMKFMRDGQEDIILPQGEEFLMLWR